jgi:PHS family inorganic phosphate transporter-like MFS transporter
MYGVELGVVIFATLGCAISSSSLALSSTAVLIFWRVLTGMGIGGEYPLSSVITAE